MNAPSKAAAALVGLALVVGLVYEIGFNGSDAFVGIVIIAFVLLAAALLALIWFVDATLVRTIAERQRLRNPTR